MKISICTSVYNGEKVLKDLFNSVKEAAKGFEEKVEHVVVNDGSSDNSKIECQEYKKSAKHKVTLINKQNGGLGSGRNEAIKNATGDYIWNVDADDEITKDAFKILLKSIETNKDIYFFDFVKMPKPGNKPWHPKKTEKWIMTKGHWPMVQAFKRDTWFKSKAKYLRQNGDIGAKVFLKFVDLKNQVEFIDKVLYIYKDSENSMSTAPKENHYENLIYNWEFLKAKGINSYKSNTRKLMNEYVVYGKLFKYYKKEKLKRFSNLSNNHIYFHFIKLVPRFLLKIIFWNLK